MGAVIFFAVMLLIAWLVVIMPQQRRVRAHQALVSRLHEGDEVMTTSGIFGTINSIDGDVLVLEVAPGVELRVIKGAIARRVSGEAEPEAGLDEPEAELDEPEAELDDPEDTGAQASSATEE